MGVEVEMERKGAARAKADWTARKESGGETEREEGRMEWKQFCEPVTH